MADPIMTGLGVGASAFTAMGGVQAAKFNEEVAGQNIGIVRQQTIAEEARVRRENIRAQGASRASRGASGVAMEGSALDIFEENAMNAELDALTVRYQGSLQERGFKNEKTLAKKEGQAALFKGLISGGKALASPTGFNFFGD